VDVMIQRVEEAEVDEMWSYVGKNKIHYRTVFLSPYGMIISEVVSSYMLC